MSTFTNEAIGTSNEDPEKQQVYVPKRMKLEGKQLVSPPAAFSQFICLCRFCDDESSEDDESDDETSEGSESTPGNEYGEQEDEPDTPEEQATTDDGLPMTRQEEEVECRSTLRMRRHLKDVTTVLLHCSEIATLRVGESRKILSCHKALLALHSEFFDAALYGSFIEGRTGILDLPEEAPEEIAVLVAWFYSGTIESELNAASLWVLGDRLRTPNFCNEVMYLITNTYGSSILEGGQWLSANTVEYIYAHTSKESLLRQFIKDMICGEGPLCARALSEFADEDLSQYKQDWEELIWAGGDLVVDASVSGFAADKSMFSETYPEAPYLWANQHKYLMDTIGTRPIESFVDGIRR